MTKEFDEISAKLDEAELNEELRAAIATEAKTGDSPYTIKLSEDGKYAAGFGVGIDQKEEARILVTGDLLNLLNEIKTQVTALRSEVAVNSKLQVKAGEPTEVTKADLYRQSRQIQGWFDDWSVFVTSLGGKHSVQINKEGMKYLRDTVTGLVEVMDGVVAELPG